MTDGEDWCVGWIGAADGTRLRLGWWPPPAGPIRGTCLLVNGRSEFLEKYAEQAREWAARGWRVVSFDWRGQGLSGGGAATAGLGEPGPGRRGHIDDFATYLADLRRVVPALLPPDAGPVVVFAHSMGGHLMLRHLLGRAGHAPDGVDWRLLILSAPMLGIDLGGLPEGLARALAGLACRLGRAQRYAPGQHDAPADADFPGNPLTGDERRFAVAPAAIAVRPALAVGGVTWGWLAAALRSIATLRQAVAHQPAPPLPTLLLSAGADRVVRPQAHAALAARWPDLVLRPYPDARHELMMETDAIRARIWADIERALSVGGLAQGAAPMV